MGGKKSWKKGGSKRKEGGEPPRKKQNTEGVRGDYKCIVRSNEALTSYYKTLGIIPDDEWEAFFEIQQTDLPATFRVIGSKGDSTALNKIMQELYFSKLPALMNDGSPTPVPSNIPWYPNNFAWQLNMSRPILRHCEELLSLHQFLVSEAERGSIARQEAVSMIPPLLLDVKPHHVVLDMCAAPGSKTLQLLESLHAEGPNPSGLIIANDGDNKRCYMLTTQTKRFNSLAYMITNEDATRYPNLKVFDENKQLKNLKYDRILCDVPCTGDGTVRKNWAIWQKWNVGQALGIHKLQRRILLRGMDMMAEGGRIVYSTCSLNPIENEATVLSALRHRPGFKLIDTKDHLPHLKRKQGLTAWRVAHSSGAWYDKFEDVPDKHLKSIAPTMFPGENIEEYNLNYCMRVYPHLQDTGGFFICIIEKERSVEPIPDPDAEIVPDIVDKGEDKKEEEVKPSLHKNTNVLVEKMKWKKFTGYREDPFIFLKEDSENFKFIKEFYNMKDSFPYGNIFVRSTESRQRNLSVACNAIKDIIEQNENRIKVINCGLRLFTFCKESFSPSPYRLLQDGLHYSNQFLQARTYKVTKEEMCKVLAPNSIPKSDLCSELYEQIKELPKGIISFHLVAPQGDSEAPDFYTAVYVMDEHIKAYITEDEKNHFRRLLGMESLITTREEKKMEVMEANKMKREATAARIDAENVDASNEQDEVKEMTPAVA